MRKDSSSPFQRSLSSEFTISQMFDQFELRQYLTWPDSRYLWIWSFQSQKAWLPSSAITIHYQKFDQPSDRQISSVAAGSRLMFMLKLDIYIQVLKTNENVFTSSVGIEKVHENGLEVRKNRKTVIFRV
jgi:hypothetical protein